MMETVQELEEKAYGKINLSLDVIGRRSDGYHLVRMIMQTVDIYDTVAISRGEATRKDGEGISVIADTAHIPLGQDNLVWRAADVMRRRFHIEDRLTIHLKKRIPIAAGMAGGSADAAAVFRLIRRMYGLSVSDRELQELALPLGADIPYCITGGTQLSEGIGEILTRLPDAPQVTLLVVKPDLDVSTGWVYKAFDSIPAEEVWHPDVDAMTEAIEKQDVGKMCSLFGNVLEQQTGAVYAVIGEVECFFLTHGAAGSIMTGSGPTVFAVYEDEKTADKAFALLRSVPEYQNFLMFKTKFITPAYMSEQ